MPTISNVATQVVPPVTLPDLALPVDVPVPVPDAGVVDGLFSYPDQLIADIIRFGFPGGQGVPGVAPAVHAAAEVRHLRRADAVPAPQVAAIVT